VRLGRVHPVVVRTGVFLVLRADERQVLDARHVGRVRVRDVTAGEGSRVELLELAGLLEILLEAGELGGGSVAPVDGVWRGELTDGFDPVGNGGGERSERGELRRGCH
jgi:hypothetical protein